MTDTKLVNGLRRGLLVLQSLNELGECEIRDLHKATALPKSTLVRLLDTLIAAGYAMHRPGEGYRVTARVLTLSAGYSANDQLLLVARPILDRLRQEQVWPSDVATFEHDAMVVLDTSRTPGTMSLNRTIGSRLPVAKTAFGRAFFSALPQDERDVAYRALSEAAEPYRLAAKDRAAFERHLETARQRGFAISDQDYLATTRAVAVPIVIHGRPLAVVNMMAVSQAVSMEKAIELFVPPLKEAANAIVAELTDSVKRIPA